MTKLNENIDGYYPCSVCGWNSPLNKVMRNSNGVEVCRCPIHQVNWEDEEKGTILEKERDRFKDDFRNAFINLDTTNIEDIDVG